MARLPGTGRATLRTIPEPVPVPEPVPGREADRELEARVILPSYLLASPVVPSLLMCACLLLSYLGIYRALLPQQSTSARWRSRWIACPLPPSLRQTPLTPCLGSALPYTTHTSATDRSKFLNSSKVTACQIWQSLLPASSLIFPPFLCLRAVHHAVSQQSTLLAQTRYPALCFQTHPPIHTPRSLATHPSDTQA